MIYYKFLRDEYALLALQTRLLKISRLSELNDPADCKPNISRLPTEVGRDGAKQFLEKLADETGVICYSTSVADPVMWTHYADEHRGMALGFEMNALRYNLNEVTYQNERPVIDHPNEDVLAENREATRDYWQKIIVKGFTQKAPSWKYEAEYRRFIPLEKCEMAGANYFQRMEPFPIKIVLGLRCRFSEGDIRRVVLQVGVSTATVVRAREDPEGYALDVT